MNKRKPISKKMRFEVFKRDSFTCQYCGKSSPNVVLHVDHIKPVKEGGKNTLTNLITSCVDCNLGKGARALSDESVIQKQKEQLDLLQEKREQMELMVKWHESLNNIDDDAVETFASYWSKHLDGSFSLNDIGKKGIKRLLKIYTIKDLLEAADIAISQYIKREDGDITQQSVEHAFNKIGGILKNKNKPEYEQKAYYIKGILKNRFSNIFNEWQIVSDIKTVHLEYSVSMEDIAQYAKTCRSISQFKTWLWDN